MGMLHIHITHLCGHTVIKCTQQQFIKKSLEFKNTKREIVSRSGKPMPGTPASAYAIGHWRLAD